MVVPGDCEALFYPGFPRIKLWRDALDHFRLDQANMTRDLTRTDKFHWHLDGVHNPSPLRLERLYVLEKSADEHTLIEPLQGSVAIAALAVNTFGAKSAQLIGMAQQHLSLSAKITRTINVFRYGRPWRLLGLDTLTSELISYLHNRN